MSIVLIITLAIISGFYFKETSEFQTLGDDVIPYRTDFYRRLIEINN
ncbi:MAG: hypothetical protein PUK80_06145 [Firmicutes bacterium]|nr:hypothetical protein [Bacillota bacterium]